jgi:hypothetical protein
VLASGAIPYATGTTLFIDGEPTPRAMTKIPGKKNTIRGWSAPLLLVLLELSAAALAQEEAARPEWVVGDTWTYARISMPTTLATATVKSNYTLTVRSKDDRYRLSYVASEDGVTTQPSPQFWSLDTNFMNRRGDGGQWQEFPWYRWPAKQGSEWSGLWLFPNTSAPSDCQATTRGWEDVKVAAGTFKALRIEIACSFIYNGNTASGTGQLQDIIWYSPRVKRHVRMQRKTFAHVYTLADQIEELTAFRVD